MDSITGSDSNSGTSASKPWRSLTPVNNHHFLPGDTVNFDTGSTWTGSDWPGGLVVTYSGVSGNPITFRSYGTGAKPLFRNLSPSWGVSVEIDADWIVIDGLAFQDSDRFGVYVGGNHDIVRNTEATQVGIGYGLYGQYNLVTQNYAHDLKMVENNPNDTGDYGAIGLEIDNSNNEVSYNRFVRCEAPSAEYGTDGGAIEWYGTISNSYVHHNWAEDDDDFIELGGGAINNTVVAYNVSINNNGSFASMHLAKADQFYAPISNFRLENNDIVDTGQYTETKWVVFAFGAAPTPGTFMAYNNIFYIRDIQGVSDYGSFTHQNNLYYFLSSSAQVGYALGSGEAIANPMFVNPGADDLDLQAGSPAIDAGLNVGLNSDFDGVPVPYGPLPDEGAYEYHGLALGVPSVQGSPQASVSVPINATAVKGLLSADIVLDYDSSVLQPYGATAGSLDQSWKVAADTPKPGELHIALSGQDGIGSNSGTLAGVRFKVLGAPGATTVLHLANSTLSPNASGTPAKMTDGLFSVNSASSGSHRIVLPLVVGGAN